jgi:hypothetical protein
MRRQRAPNPLGITLDRLLARRGLSGLEFCRRAGLARSTWSNLKHRKPTAASSEDEVHRWAVILALSQSEERELFEAAQLAFSPAWVQALVTRLKAENEALTRRVT